MRLMKILPRTSDEQLHAKTAATRKREEALARIVMIFISTGLAFMLLPGAFLGVWNLLSISNKHAAASISAAWIQAHGHAQVFGWIGTFILGIGFYSIPRVRNAQPFALWEAWSCWLLWTVGVTARWAAGVYQWHWLEQDLPDLLVAVCEAANRWREVLHLIEKNSQRHTSLGTGLTHCWLPRGSSAQSSAVFCRGRTTA